MLKTTLKVACFGLSDIGLVRKKNEDAWRALPDEGLFLLADGMGGHQGGEVAAKAVVSLLSEHVLSIEAGSLEDEIKRVNAAIYQRGRTDETLSGMGTTLCVLYLREEEAILAHVGDSRIYRLRHSHLERLTEDHSLVNELLGAGAIKPEEGSLSSYKHILTRAIGTQATVDVTLSRLSIDCEDLFLLCSDGLTNFVSDEEIQKILTEESYLERGGYRLVDLAKKHGGGDNITVLLVKIEKR